MTRAMIGTRRVDFRGIWRVRITLLEHMISREILMPSISASISGKHSTALHSGSQSRVSCVTPFLIAFGK